MYLWKPVSNLPTIRGGARNISDGSKVAAMRHFSKTVAAIHDDEGYGQDLAAMVDLIFRDPNKSLVVYSETYYIFKHPTQADIDCVVINQSGIYLSNFNNRANDNAFRVAMDAAKFKDSVSVLDNIKGFIDSIEDEFTSKHGYRTRLDHHEADDSGRVQIFVLDKTTGDILTSAGGDEDENAHLNHEFDGEFILPEIKNKSLTTSSNPVKSATEAVKNTQTTGEVKMTKVTAIVAANKSAAQTAVKIEAGNIALDKVVALIAPKMPFGTASYLKSPIGKVVVANLISFGVSQYAANNPKAQIISDAVMEAAALQLVQSFNVGALIDDLIGSVNLSGLEPEEGLAKYSVKAE
jgi:hypothetical protein